MKRIVTARILLSLGVFAPIFPAGAQQVPVVLWPNGRPEPIEEGRRNFLWEIFESRNQDCSALRRANLTVVRQPLHGRAVVVRAKVGARYSSDDPRAQCGVAGPGSVSVFYEPNRGYRGHDHIEFDTFVSGGTHYRHIMDLVVQ